MKQRRRLIKETYTEEHEREVLNKAFDPAMFKKAVKEGWNYNVPQFIYVTHYQDVTDEERSVLEYQITCVNCKTKVWKKRKAKYCCDSCRVISYKNRKKAKEMKKRIEKLE